MVLPIDYSSPNEPERQGRSSSGRSIGIISIIIAGITVVLTIVGGVMLYRDVVHPFPDVGGLELIPIILGIIVALGAGFISGVIALTLSLSKGDQIGRRIALIGTTFPIVYLILFRI